MATRGMGGTGPTASQAVENRDFTVDVGTAMENALAKAPGPTFKTLQSRTNDAIKEFGEETLRQLLRIRSIVHEGDPPYNFVYMIDQLGIALRWSSPKRVSLEAELGCSLEEMGTVTETEKLANMLCTSLFHAIEEYIALEHEDREKKYGGSDVLDNIWIPEDMRASPVDKR